MTLKKNLPLYLLLICIALLLAYARFKPKAPAPTTYDACLADKRSSIEISSGTCKAIDGTLFSPSPTPAFPSPTPITEPITPVDWQEISLPFLEFALPADFALTSSSSAELVYSQSASESAALTVTVGWREASTDLESYTSNFIDSLPGTADEWESTPITIDDTPANFLGNAEYGFEVLVIEPSEEQLINVSFNEAFNAEAALGEQILNTITFPSHDS